MKKNMLFMGLGVLVSAILLFLLKLSKGAFLSKPLNLLIIFGALSVVFLVWGLVKRMNKPLLFFGLGILVDAILVFLLSLIKLTDNVSLLVIFLLVSVGLLLYGAIKK